MKKGCIRDFVYSDKTSDISGDRHHHNVYQLIYIKYGSIRLEVADSVYNCTAPCLIFISSLEPHSLTIESNEYKRYIITVDPEVASQDICPQRLLTVFSTRRGDFCHSLDISSVKDEIDLIVNRINDEHTRDDVEGETVWLTALLHLLYRLSPALFRDAESQSERTVNAVRGELERNLGESLNLDEIAAKYYISRYYLAHIFKDVTGYSVKRYRMFCRISYARELLTGTDLTIAEIAERTGFNDTSNFARYFREKIGMTPTEYRVKSQK